MKHIVIIFAAVILTGCTTHTRQAEHPQAAPPSEASPFKSRTITVVLTNPVVFVGGEVMHPGRYDWIPGLTLTNAIALAGGFTDFADRRQLEIRRPTGVVERYSYRQVVDAG